MTMHRLSGFDASLLEFESAEQPMNTCTLMELDTSSVPGGYSFEGFYRQLSDRLPALPEFRTKVVDSRFNLDAPVLVDDPDFDLAQHVHRVDLPEPGGRRELSLLAGQLASERLRRDRPLWDIWVIEGLPDEQESGSAIALMLRVHHVLVDGVTARDMLSRLCSEAADSGPPAAVPGVTSARMKDIVFDGALRFGARPWHVATKLLPGALRGAIVTTRRTLAGRAMASPLSVPRTPFNGDVGRGRNIAYAQLDLAEVIATKDAFNVKLNDVMLALISGALRHYLLARKELPKTALVALIPVSVFDPNRAGRNQLSPIFSSLHTDVADPAARLSAIADASSVAKQHHSAVGPTLLQDIAQYLPGLLALLMRLYRRSGLSRRRPVYNVSLSNVRGSSARFLMGAAITAKYPLGPVVNGVGLNISVVSADGRIDVGFVACSRLLPDLWDLADRLHDELRELHASALKLGAAHQTG